MTIIVTMVFQHYAEVLQDENVFELTQYFDLKNRTVPPIKVSLPNL